MRGDTTMHTTMHTMTTPTTQKTTPAMPTTTARGPR
jgi:hypothetical protein